MAHKKGAGSTKNGRDSNSKRLGVKNMEDSMLLQGTYLYVKKGQNLDLGIMLA